MTYYTYLVATLPALTLGEDPPVSSEEFLTYCRERMPANDVPTLTAARLRPAEAERALAVPPGESDDAEEAGGGGFGSERTGGETPTSASGGGGGVSSGFEESLSASSGEGRSRSKSYVARRWLQFEYALRNTLVELRTDGSEEAGRYRRGSARGVGGPRVEQAAREAVGAENPAEAERILDRARFGFLDELESGHYLDFERLVAYFLKLQLLERRSFMKPEIGRRAFEVDYGRVLKTMQRAAEGVVGGSGG